MRARTYIRIYTAHTHALNISPHTPQIKTNNSCVHSHVDYHILPHSSNTHIFSSIHYTHQHNCSPSFYIHFRGSEINKKLSNHLSVFIIYTGPNKLHYRSTIEHIYILHIFMITYVLYAFLPYFTFSHSIFFSQSFSFSLPLIVSLPHFPIPYSSATSYLSHSLFSLFITFLFSLFLVFTFVLKPFSSLTPSFSLPLSVFAPFLTHSIFLFLSHALFHLSFALTFLLLAPLIVFKLYPLDIIF